MKKPEEKAKEYAEGKSSSSVFQEAHAKDFLSGYNQSIEDLVALVESKIESVSMFTPYSIGRKQGFKEILEELKKLNDDEGK